MGQMLISSFPSAPSGSVALRPVRAFLRARRQLTTTALTATATRGRPPSRGRSAAGLRGGLLPVAWPGGSQQL